MRNSRLIVNILKEKSRKGEGKQKRKKKLTRKKEGIQDQNQGS